MMTVAEYLGWDVSELKPVSYGFFLKIIFAHLHNIPVELIELSLQLQLNILH